MLMETDILFCLALADSLPIKTIENKQLVTPTPKIYNSRQIKQTTSTCWDLKQCLSAFRYFTLSNLWCSRLGFQGRSFSQGLILERRFGNFAHGEHLFDNKYLPDRLAKSENYSEPKVAGKLWFQCMGNYTRLIMASA